MNTIQGAFNVVTGLGETAGAALANHDDVDKITFTGSTEVGRILVRASAGNLKKVSNAFDNASPWGGFKQSGWGREKGPYGLDLFTQIKSVIINYT